MTASKDVDYAKLSVDELIDVADHIDREAFPDRAAIVDAELAKRSAAASRELTAEEIAFDADLDRYLRWRRIAPVSLLALMPLEAIVGIPLTNLTASIVPFFAVGITCIAVYMVFAMKLSLFTCPRCLQRFTRVPQRAEDGFLALVSGRLRSNLLASACVNCGLAHTVAR